MSHLIKKTINEGVSETRLMKEQVSWSNGWSCLDYKAERKISKLTKETKDKNKPIL